MIGAEIPPEILITAMSSRLVDLQTARMDDEASQFTVPDPTPNAEQRAYSAAALLFTLDRTMLQGSVEYSSIQSLHQVMQDSGHAVTEDQIRFAARFLGAEREIRYLGEKFETLNTRNFTQLVRYQSRQDRVKLTIAGQHFIRMVRHTGEWLYADKDIEKLSSAIRSGTFNDIGRLCADIQSALRMQNERITSIRESQSNDTLQNEYMEHREHFTEMLEGALRAALEAKEMLATDETLRRLSTFNATQPDHPIRSHSLNDALSIVHQATESLSRNWSGLLKDLQGNKRQQMGVLRFDKIIDTFLDNPPTEIAMTAFLAGSCGWIPRPQIIGVDTILGKLSHETASKDKPDLVFDMDPAAEQSNPELASWLTRNVATVKKLLDKGPIHLVDLITDKGLPDCPILSIEEFGEAIGLYAIRDNEGQEVDLEVVCLPDLVKTEGWGHHIGVSNVLLRHAIRVED